MVTVLFTRGAGSFVLNSVDRAIQSITVETEANKGYSSCSMSIHAPRVDKILHRSIDGRTDIRVFENGDLIWNGIVSSLSYGGTTLNIDGVGYHDLLNRYYYSDGSEGYYYMYIQTEVDGSPIKVLESADDKYGVAARVQSTIGWDTPVLSFQFKLQRVGDPAGNITPFISTGTLTSGLAYGDSIPVESVTADAGGEVFEMSIINTEDIVSDDGFFYVGFETDGEYQGSADASNYLAIYGDSVVSGGTGYYKDSGGTWTNQATHLLYCGVVSRGKWDYTGISQKEIIQDIFAEYDRLFAEAIPIKEYYANVDDYFLTNMSPVPIEPDTKAYDVLVSVLERGADLGTEDYHPLQFYIYSHSNWAVPQLFIDPIDYSVEAFVRIVSKGEGSSVDLDYGGLATQIVGRYETEDGLRAETTPVLTGLELFSYPQEVRVDLGTVSTAEADIMIEFIAERETNPFSTRSITVNPADVWFTKANEHYPLSRLRAGQMVYLESEYPIYNPVAAKDILSKYLIRKTSYDPIGKTMTIDLSRSADKDILAEILQIR